MEKRAYGATKKQIAEQFQKYVDARFVPTRFKVDGESADDQERNEDRQPRRLLQAAFAEGFDEEEGRPTPTTASDNECTNN